MIVTMLVDVSGTWNGRRWPRRGTTADLPEPMARSAIASGHAEAGGGVETAVDRAVVETGALPEPETAVAPSDDVEVMTTSTGPNRVHLRPLGGGWYELPNGERIRGQADAQARLAEIQGDDGPAGDA